MRDYFKVLQVGQTGKGKTYSFRNMNIETTGFINIEDKPLPFNNKFKYHSRPRTVAEVKKALKDYAENPEIQVICIDSFSAYVEILLADCRATKNGFDIWNKYNDEIGKFLTFIKAIQKEVFISAHYEILNIEGNPEKRVKVKGKEWEGMIEREFTVVLYAESKTSEKGKPEFYFEGWQEGSSAKCPPGLLGEDTFRIQNDSQLIYEKILEFTK